MNDLVRFLCEGDHPVQVSLRPERTLQNLKDCVDRGYVHIKFTDTRGGTELGVTIDRQRSDLKAFQVSRSEGEVMFIGDLTLDYVPVTCVARIDLHTLEGKGHLQVIQSQP